MLRAVHGLKAADSPSTSFFLLSNSNTVYIDTILKVRTRADIDPRSGSRPADPLSLCPTRRNLQHRKLTDFFARITTNPSAWDENEKLIIKRRVDPSGPQHTCKVGCSANMCKGASSCR
jgi:pyridoxal phosphate phosphatase PHOSPHO2